MANSIKIKNVPEGFQSVITNGKHSILADEPLKSGGTDLGFSPVDLLLSGLGLCKVTTVRYIARKNNWQIGDVKAELSHETRRGENGLKTQVKVKMLIEGDLTQEQKAELLKQADRCYVHRMIEGEWDIEHAVEAHSLELKKLETENV
ncbi:disulfide bond formation regulator [Flavobacterium cyanobacteriorum]|uniref:Disulfide bond formation regulator n=1 Tax=Flavobacterium cyanobacteriorum TaxID=2022802 RepID=A0A255YXX7_9FLAO|nr:OsmC family protein [Flavobacterium cyanobacteriorum]OYQ34087.1 disulfide bond formation regulator [Flavobacterium cyanobacteriorum]